MPKPNQETAQAQEPEQVITVDMDAADPKKTIERGPARGDDVTDQVRQQRSNGDDRGGNDDDRDQLTASMRKRLARMGRSFNQRLADQEARHQREIAALRGNGGGGVTVEGKEKDLAKLDTDHNTAMAALKEKLEAAIEKGDSRTQADITAQMQRAEGKYWSDRAKLEGLATRDAGAGGGSGAAATGGGAARTTGPTVAGSRFIRANEEWWEDPEYKVEQNAANTLFTVLTREEGYSPNDDETFREIARRLKEKFPNLEVRAGKGPGDDEDDDDEDAREEARRESQRQHTRRQVRSGGQGAQFQDRGAETQRQARRSGRIVITQKDQATMRTVGMDPNNNDHVMRWIRESQALEA